MSFVRMSPAFSAAPIGVVVSVGTAGNKALPNARAFSIVCQSSSDRWKNSARMIASVNCVGLSLESYVVLEKRRALSIHSACQRGTEDRKKYGLAHVHTLYPLF